MPKLDPIAFLRSNGFLPTPSRDGVRFPGNKMAGIRARLLAEDAGFAVVELRRIWGAADAEPIWELTLASAEQPSRGRGVEVLFPDKRAG